MAKRSLQSLIDQAGGAVSYARSTKYHRRDVPAFSPPLIIPQVPYEFTGWEREQRAWRESVALLDQSHHMQAAIVKGPDARSFLSHLACNNLEHANPSRAFQIICVSPEGDMIGDGILLQSEANEFAAVGPFILSWIRYQAEALDFDVQVEIDARSPTYGNGFANSRPECRYQLQGPLAWALIERLNGGPINDVPFFHVTEMRVAGIRMRALRHGMAGTPGLEIWGPWERRGQIRDEILKVGEEFGIVEVGAGAYCSSGIESGWFQGAMPGIYTSESTRAYREWLTDDALEAVHMLTGSRRSNRLDDYYRTPFDLGYGRFIHFDHDFIGRDALRSKAKEPNLKKVTLAWNADDAASLLKEMMLPEGRNLRMLHLPIVNDKISVNYDTLTRQGEDAGTAHYTAYLATERAMLTLALVDEAVSVGDEVVIGWGEAGGGYGDYIMPATDVIPIRAIVSPAPYSRVAREEYRTNAVYA
jgi:vanillate/3-O-methylgallate O-demethylase